MTGLKWMRKSTRKIAEELAEFFGVEVGRTTVRRLLKEEDYSLKVNAKTVATCRSEDRDEQFSYIAALRKRCAAAGSPLISVDTKKREMVGLFKNPGTTWQRDPISVNDHDFLTDALGVAIPYGLYDIHANHGTVFVGTSKDTSAFAVDCIERWWRRYGRKRYPDTTELFILADSGGSNGCNRRAWKLHLYDQLCKRHGLTVTVSHYPTGASKWNPIEHRLFSEISKEWAGQPLDSYETVINYMRRTTTRTGLTVDAHLVRKHYRCGEKISDQQIAALSITKDPALPKWNYTLRPC